MGKEVEDFDRGEEVTGRGKSENPREYVVFTKDGTSKTLHTGPWSRQGPAQIAKDIVTALQYNGPAFFDAIRTAYGMKHGKAKAKAKAKADVPSPAQDVPSPASEVPSGTGQ